jgi:hypothetical protein
MRKPAFSATLREAMFPTSVRHSMISRSSSACERAQREPVRRDRLLVHESYCQASRFASIVSRSRTA